MNIQETDIEFTPLESAALIVADLRKLGFQINLAHFVQHRRIGELLNVLCTNGESTGQMTIGHKGRLFIREYRPGQTFPANSDVEALCRDTITKVVVESFMKAGTIKKLLNLSETTLKQIVVGRLHQLETLPGMVYLAGFTQMEPGSALEDLLPDVSGVTFLMELGVPAVAGVDDPKYDLMEEFFEVCGLQAGPIRGDERCLRVMLASALHCTTAGHDRIRLILQMEKKSIEDAMRLGYTAIRSINTSVVTQAIAEELGYVNNCDVDAVKFFESRGFICNQDSLVCKVATKKLRREDV
ncbi:unnamed protein product [Mesocestoides corti]|uniref:Uncharacterized protein n=2 Tax=Mesocestoides corti TaxID=53468 RepID=A0A0R3UA87_MESCO|nr:unnamed protein product [Mesocestoides corti]